MRIGIYGGSFNPVHNGHLGVARAAIADLGLDRLIVVPAAVSPFKADEAVEPPRYDRLLLVRAAFNGMEKVTVDDRELKRGGISYAIDTVREIIGEFVQSPASPSAHSASSAHDEFFFIVGEDSVAGLPKWKEAETLWNLCTPKAYPRTRESSTEIRARLAKGEPIDDLVPPTVALFIRHGVVYNADKGLADTVLKGLERKGGYCPCRLPKTPEFFCPCDEFKSQLADSAYHGLCHCRLYEKK